MPELKGDIQRLPGDRIETSVAMLTRAFSGDPKLGHFLPEITAKKELSRFLFEFELRYGINYGEVYTTSPATEGVVCLAAIGKIRNNVLEGN